MKMTHAEWIAHLKRERKKKPNDTLLSQAARLVRLEAECYEGCGGHTWGLLQDIADQLDGLD
jgi:phage gp16-like protein